MSFLLRKNDFKEIKIDVCKTFLKILDMFDSALTGRYSWFYHNTIYFIKDVKELSWMSHRVIRV